MSQDPSPSPTARRPTHQGPGRLGNPSMKLFQEPRAHPKIVSAFRAFGMDGSRPNPLSSLPAEQLRTAAAMAKSHEGTAKLYEIMPNDLPGDDEEPDVVQSLEYFAAPDGTQRKLHVFRRKDVDARTQPVPGVLYIHGGGMTVLDTANKVHFRWCRSLAVQGLVAIAADFRNAWTPEGHNPFPIGLNDCVAAVRTVLQRKAELGISKVVLQGESGGANLSLATALTANKEGWMGEIAGVYGIVPYISNGYGWDDARKIKELPSLYECDGYWLFTDQMAGMGYYYSGNENATNPLAWPYYAAVKDCVGLPPHVLAMDELDPLRDEGMAYYRKLIAAGVEATAKVNMGAVHASSLILRKLLPEVFNSAIRDIAAFAKSL